MKKKFLFGQIILFVSAVLSSTCFTVSCVKEKDEIKVTDLTFTANGVSFDMVYVKRGIFYYIGKHEVTQGLWKAVMGTDIRDQLDSAKKYMDNQDLTLEGEGDSYPMYYVSWRDIQTFLSKLNSMTGENFTLPTEDQWIFAALGGTKSEGYTYSGSNNIDEVAWYIDNSDSTHPVGTKKPNELGIYDMSGNVSECCGISYDLLIEFVGIPEYRYCYIMTAGGNFNYPRGSCTVTSIKAIQAPSGTYNFISSIKPPIPTEAFSDVGFRLALLP